ncbi:antitoxin VbhA family protein [Alkanindiges hydrocarboniclasticus]|nr:antitoxin VbhA family protein [Alkanindiges hydrocarboniclasticus]
MRQLSSATQRTLGLLAVDNIKVSDVGLDLLEAVDRGQLTTEQAKAVVHQKATQLFMGSTYFQGVKR